MSLADLLGRTAGGLAERGRRAHAKLVGDALKMGALATWSSSRFFEGVFLPSLRALGEIDHEIALATLRSLLPGAEASTAPLLLAQKMAAGMRYAELVGSLGGELFGSARFAGEEVLSEDATFRLVFVPPAPEAAPAGFAVLHVGGVLPYGDRLFRLLPEVNFYDRFRERGVPLYALELRGDARSLDYRGLTLDGVHDSVERFGAVARAHAGGAPLVLEGYCALASQALSYVAARPEAARRDFAALALFVGPVDGTRCGPLAESIRLMPDDLLAGAYAVAEHTEGYVGGDSLRLTQDLALETSFVKTPLGAFLAGFKQPELARARTIADLSPEQRKGLAGAFWISPENGRRYPVPLDLSRFSGALFKSGVAADGTIAHAVAGRPLSLAGVAASGLPVIGFYGGKDVLVPETTAEPLRRLLGTRYTHVVHPGAGHISYVFSPKIWRAGPKALDPNPIDAIAKLVEPGSAR